MIDSIYNILFRCRHRRTTFPLSPVSRPGAPQGDKYVVCLDCGKRLPYDWERMRIGTPAPETAGSGKSRLRFFVGAFALPVGWLIGKAAYAFQRRRRAKT